MHIKFLGAAGTVTGSCHMIETDSARFSIDCGMHQGNEAIERRNLDTAVYEPTRLDCILLTHAHIDHSGLLPRLVRTGFSGRIFCTPPTRDLLGIMLEDSAHIQEMEAEWTSRRSRRHGGRPVEPLYTQADAAAATKLLTPIPYGKSFSPVPGVTAIYHDAGHILGSAFIELTLEKNGSRTRMLFSGDLGRPDQLLVNDPDKPVDADSSFSKAPTATGITRTRSRAARNWPRPSPTAIAGAVRSSSRPLPWSEPRKCCSACICCNAKARSDRYAGVRGQPPGHPGDRDLQAQSRLSRPRNPGLLRPGRGPVLPAQPALHPVHGPVPGDQHPGRAGHRHLGQRHVQRRRVKHHLRHNLWRPESSVVFVGFQAAGTPGRKIVDGAKTIRLLGEEVAVAARVFTIGGFSSHAGQSQILQWLTHFRGNHPEVFLIHGEQKALETLSGLIKERFGLKVRIPQYLEEYTLTRAPEPMVSVDEAKAHPRIDWDFLLAEMEGRLDQLRARKKKLAARPVEVQAEVRQRLLTVNKDLLELLSEV